MGGKKNLRMHLFRTFCNSLQLGTEAKKLTLVATGINRYDKATKMKKVKSWMLNNTVYTRQGVKNRVKGGKMGCGGHCVGLR